MSDNASIWKPGAFTRYLILVPALVVAVSLGFTGAASAQTAFQADVTGTVTLPTGCATGAFFCGTADIAGYGAASWNFFVTNVTLSQTSCGTTYTATTDFTLASDGSTLVVNERGYVCLPGNDGAGWFAEGPHAYGHPNYPQGTWTFVNDQPNQAPRDVLAVTEQGQQESYTFYRRTN